MAEAPQQSFSVGNPGLQRLKSHGHNGYLHLWVHLPVESPRWALRMGMGTSSLAVSTVIAGFFGMNLQIGLEEGHGMGR